MGSGLDARVRSPSPSVRSRRFLSHHAWAGPESDALHPRDAASSGTAPPSDTLGHWGQPCLRGARAPPTEPSPTLPAAQHPLVSVTAGRLGQPSNQGNRPRSAADPPWCSVLGRCARSSPWLCGALAGADSRGPGLALCLERPPLLS